jgi:hypothetical protein
MTGRRTSRVLAVVLIAGAVPAGCGGDSQEERAQADVCAARADISKQVDQLQGLTATTFTADAVRENLRAIQDDVQTIEGARDRLASDNRDEIASANDDFKASVRETASDAGRSISLQTARTQLEETFDQLAASYRDTLAKIDCS